jgi:hypothetical protein
MRDESKQIEFMLMDWHLGDLSAEDESRLAEAVRRSPELSAQSEALGRILKLLDQDIAPEAPSGLADSVLAHISSHEAVLPFPTKAAALHPAQEYAAGPVLSLRELVAIAACIILFVGIFVPGYYKAQNIVQRRLCGDHLRQIWMGMANYSESNDGYLAYSGYVPGAS